MGDDLAAVDFGVGAPAVVALSAGEGHTCAIFEGGSLKVRYVSYILYCSIKLLL